VKYPEQRASLSLGEHNVREHLAQKAGVNVVGGHEGNDKRYHVTVFSKFISCAVTTKQLLWRLC